MINRTLYKKEWKSNWILLLIFCGVLTMYASMIVSMFDPKLGDSLRMMAESMPDIFAAFGMADVGTTLLEFITGYLYGMLLIAFPAVYIIILSHRLVAKYVDSGSIVYLLAVPQKRSKIIRTQMIYLVSSLFLMLVYVMALIIGVSQVMFSGELDMTGFLKLNIGVFGLWIMLAGVCFFMSCIFNESKWSLGCSTAVFVYALLVQMISQVGDKFEKLKYATPLTLFQTDGLIEGTHEAWMTCGIMYIVGIVFFTAGALIFKKRDIPV